MAEEFDTIADLRPLIKRDVLFTEIEDGVLFHNPDTGFEVRSKSAYRFAALVVPYLDGMNRMGDLFGGLPDGQRQMAARLVKALIDRGLARDVPVHSAPGGDLLSAEEAAEFASQLSYIDHYENGGTARFLRFRKARVAVAGDDLVACWCALSLIRNGCSAIDVPPGIAVVGNAFDDVVAEAAALTARGAPASVGFLPGLADGAAQADGGAQANGAGQARAGRHDVIVCTGAQAPYQVLRLLRAGIGDRIVLPVTIAGHRVVVGPAMAGSRPPCWVCAMLRVAANSDDGAAADVWRRTCLPEAPSGAGVPSGPLAAMIGNLAGYEVFRLLTGAPAAETLGQVIVQDLDSLDTRTELVAPHPCCPFCRAGGAGPVVIAPAAPPSVSLDAIDQADGQLMELAAQSRLVGRVAGVFRAFDDDWVTQTPLKVSRVTLAVGPGRQRTVTAFDLHTVAAARLRVLRAAAAVYAGHVVPLPVLAADALAAAGAELPKVPPADIVTASGTWAGSQEITEWVVAASMTDGEGALVPAAAVGGFGPANAAGAFATTSAGTGVGRTQAEAVYLALFSALCREGIMAAIRGAGPVLQIPLDALEPDPELRFLTSSARNLGLGAELLDLTKSCPAGPSVLLARAADPGGGAALWAAASDGTWRNAARDALRDLIGMAQAEREAPGTPPDTGDPLVAAFDPWTLTANGQSAPPLDAATSATQVLDRLRASGLRALTVSLTSPDLHEHGLSVLRVVLAGRGPS